MTPSDPLSALRPAARAVPPSGIIDVVAYGFDRPDVIPLWAGEGDLPTPPFIAEAATRALAAGETFYTYQRGLPDLRRALASYHERLFGRPFDADGFIVTGSGMQAIQISLQATVGPGEEVIVPTPAWPNLSAAAMVLEARPVEVPMTFDGSRWTLPPETIEAAVTPRTRAIFVNTPSNPSGWVADRETLAALLSIARRHGLWIIADEIYNRFHWTGEGARSPSFLDVAAPDDLILFVNTFSKNWAMTGWRMGWIMAPPAVIDTLANLVQYSTSGVAAFMQRAGIVALDNGDGFLAHQVERARRGREIVVEALGGLNGVAMAVPDGAFYALITVEGETDTPRFAKRLIDEAGVGLAPGTAFGSGGEPFLRLCFARGEKSLSEAMDRLSTFLRSR